VERKGGRDGNGDEEVSFSGKKERGKEGVEGWKVVFWNVTGLRNKDKEFWTGLVEEDVMVLSETWADEKRWERVKRNIPKKGVQLTKKKSKKRRRWEGW